MPITVKRVTFRSYAGPSIRGNAEYALAANAGHWERAFKLTSDVESGGKFGAITMYDGTGVTAGLHQAIAVYPRELANEDFNALDDQGSLFDLLRRIELLPNVNSRAALWQAMADVNWLVARDSKLRYLANAERTISGKKVQVKAGDLVYGQEIRNTFTPTGGLVPASGPAWDQSKRWAILFHDMFSDASTFRCQVEFGMEHLQRGVNRKLKYKGKNQTIEQIVYCGNAQQADPLGGKTAIDLAMSVLWSNAVNGPAPAMTALQEALDSKPKDQDELARTLINELGNNSYGRWDDDIPEGRYQRTRVHAMKIWPAELFADSGIMPRNLPG